MSIHDIVYEMLVIADVNARGNGKPKLFASFLQVTSRVWVEFTSKKSGLKKNAQKPLWTGNVEA